MHISRKKKSISTHTRKIQHGGAKFNFAYTFLMLTKADIAGKDAFIAYIKAQSQRCVCLEDRVPGCDADRGAVLGDNQFLIIAIKYDMFSEVMVNPNKLNEAGVQAAILGHAIIATHPGNKLIGIYGICAHRASTAEKSYGSVLLNIILSAIKLSEFDKEVTGYWLGINLNNPSLHKLIHLYTSFGFKHPFVSNIDPFGNEQPFYFLTLTNLNAEYVTFEGASTITFNKSVDIINNLKSVIRAPEHVPKMTFTMDKSCILNLRLFPYLGVNGIQPIRERDSQREYSGSFKIYESTIVNGKVIYTISNTAAADSRAIKYDVGGHEHSLPQLDTSYSFHTHPISLYLKYNVCIGTPSGQDYYNTILHSLKHLVRFTMVASIEGLYVLSLSEDFIRSIRTKEEIEAKIVYIVANGPSIIAGSEFPFERRRYDWTTHVTGDPDRTIVDAAIRDYLAFINSKGVIEVQIIRWVDLTKSKKITISYPFIYLNAFADAYDAKIIYDLFPNVAFDNPAKYVHDRLGNIRARIPRLIEGNRANRE